MHFLDPDIFSEVIKLSTPTLIAILLCGLLLWSAGYLTHKFWVVFLATAGAGVLGFDKGPDFGNQIKLHKGIIHIISFAQGISKL